MPKLSKDARKWSKSWDRQNLRLPEVILEPDKITANVAHFHCQNGRGTKKRLTRAGSKAPQAQGKPSPRACDQRVRLPDLLGRVLTCAPS